MLVATSNLQDVVEVDQSLEDLTGRVVRTVVEAIQPGRSPALEVSVAFVDDERIRELNREYRDIDKSTDVLSFPMDEDDVQGEDEAEEEVLLGDVVISLPTALRQAREYEADLAAEVARLLVHGTLHLLGFDHLQDEDAEVMRAKETSILRQLGYEVDYA